MSRILVGGTWDAGDGYPRAASLLAALRRSGHQVTEYRAPLPYGGRAKRQLLRQPLRWPAAAARLLGARRRFACGLRRAIAECDPEVVVVPYPGHHVVQWVRREYQGPILLDLFLSAHDTAVTDRQLFAPGSAVARWLRRLDRRACAAASMALLDTPEHAAAVADLVGLPASKFSWVPVSDPAAPPTSPPYRGPRRGAPLEVLFFGTGVPLHGLPVLLQAVTGLDCVRLRLIGGAAADRAAARRLPNVDVGPEFVSRSELARALAASQLVAGVFSSRPKAQRVVPFKVAHALAAGRPVLTAATPAVLRFLQPGRDCRVCPPDDPAALAESLRDVAHAPQQLDGIAGRARATYDRCFSEAAVAVQLDRALADLGVAVASAAPAAPAAPVAAAVPWP